MWFRNSWCPYLFSSSRVRDMPSGYLNFSYYSCRISLTNFLEPLTLLLYSFIDSHYFFSKLIFPTYHCHFPIIFLSEISCVIIDGLVFSQDLNILTWVQILPVVTCLGSGRREGRRKMIEELTFFFQITGNYMTEWILQVNEYC